MQWEERLVQVSPTPLRKAEFALKQFNHNIRIPYSYLLVAVRTCPILKLETNRSPINGLCPHFYCKVQLIQNILTNILVPPHPVRVDLHNFEEFEWTKIGRAAACQSQRVLKFKRHLFVYEIRRHFGEYRRRKCGYIYYIFNQKY
jgi:hypothetical protein